VDLDGKVVVVTGAASGIGYGMAERFAGAGMRVVLADVEEPALDKAGAELERLGTEVLTVETDVSDAESVEALAEATYRRFGAAHVVCNNAGVVLHAPIYEAQLSDWEWVLGVNLWGVVHGMRAFVPRMIEGGEPGHVVNTASGAGLFCLPGLGVYAVAKHGVVALSETLVQDLRAAGHPIGVSVVCPSYTSTRLSISDRNRPERFGGPTTNAGDGTMLVPDGVDAELASPAFVADRVHDAVVEERFWVFTHPHTTAIVKRWADAMASGTSFFGGDDPRLESR
jgi:NAD(P)-dependent dehydrogenase (short-subunit alcohol dehydrogenase family)